MTQNNNIVRVLALVIIIAQVALLGGCIKPKGINIVGTIDVEPKIEASGDDVIEVAKEVDKVMEYIYSGGEKPSGEYMECVDMLINEKKGQKIYMKDFLANIDKLIEELEEEYDLEVDQDGNNTVEDDVDEDDIEDEVTDVQLTDTVLPNSSFIKTDDKGRDYISIDDIKIASDEMTFVYNNEEYMLDEEEYSMSIDNIRLKNPNYVFIHGVKEEGGLESYELVYLDTKTGKAKTVTAVKEDGKIQIIYLDI